MSHDELFTAGNGKLTQTVPDPEVTLKAKRRTFSAEYKLRILDEASACRRSGERGALLRREGLYSSHLTHWRRELREGARAGLKPKKRGPKRDALAVENVQLKGEIARLQAKLERAETIIDVQKKLSQLLGLPTASETDENSGSPR
jgi:transposase-like protein